MSSSSDFAVGLKAALRERSVRRWALSMAGGLAVVVGFTECAKAQDSPAQEPPAHTDTNFAADSAAMETVEVTGSRIIRSGFTSPTPTTMIGEDEIQSAAQPNIFNVISQLPAFEGNSTTTAGNTGIGGGTGGLNLLNLRGLGTNRTLVLLDGRRTVAAATTGVVDINQLPQALISRVDVVTGGASAAYGSDAVGGVVNFILNRNFTGLEGEAETGVTTYGDDQQSRVALTGGTGFADDRGHFLISGEWAGQHGVGPRWNRPWYNASKVLTPSIAQTPAGSPQYVVANNVGSSQMTNGGLIPSGPLQGIAFGQGGTPYNFDYGVSPYGPTGLMSGGQWQGSDNGNASSLDTKQDRETLYTRLSFDVTSSINVWAEGSYGREHTELSPGTVYYNGNQTIQCDNAFLPASVSDQCAATNIQSFAYGNTLSDLPQLQLLNDRTIRRGAVGAEGKLDALGTTWKWSANLGYGTNKLGNQVRNDPITVLFKSAIDAVRGPNGTIVCRSALTQPGNGCIPLNIIGLGGESQAAIQSVLGASLLNQQLSEETAGFDFSGDPFHDWAGPVSVAAGFEWRKDAVSGASDCLSYGNCGNPTYAAAGNNYRSGNFHSVNGSYKVSEGFFETVIPLAEDVPFAKSADLNGAVRITDYSLAGTVETWKIGATWSPINDFKVRATRSRDIRAPNLSELFTAQTVNSQSVIDDFEANAGKSVQILRYTTGNTQLQPEVADNIGAGIVLMPHWLPGFAASIDYYRIKVANAIATLTNQQQMDLCFQGNQVLCNTIQRNAAGQVVSVTGQPINLASQNMDGIDYEASYRTTLSNLASGWSGDIKLRLLLTGVMSDKLISGLPGDIPHQLVAENSGITNQDVPRWRGLASQTYNLNSFSATLTERWISAGVLDTAYIQCTADCPVSTTLNPTINDNHVPSVFYLDFSAAQKFLTDEKGRGLEVFFRVDNLANRAPPSIAGFGSNPFTLSNVNPQLYDVLGRYVRIGFRFTL